MEDDFENFDWNHHLDSLGMVVVGNMNDADDGGILGVDMKCYAYYGVYRMVGGHTDSGGRMRVLLSPICGELSPLSKLKGCGSVRIHVEKKSNHLQVYN